MIATDLSTTFVTESYLTVEDILYDISTLLKSVEFSCVSGILLKYETPRLETSSNAKVSEKIGKVIFSLRCVHESSVDPFLAWFVYPIIPDSLRSHFHVSTFASSNQRAPAVTVFIVAWS